MAWFIFGHLVAFLVDLVADKRRANEGKDLEIALLRHQLRILQRRCGRTLPLARWEKLTLAVLAAKLNRLVVGRGGLRRSLVLFQPETVLRWHRDLVRRKWTYRRSRGGPPAVGRRARSPGPAACRRERVVGLQPDPQRAAQAGSCHQPVRRARCAQTPPRRAVPAAGTPRRYLASVPTSASSAAAGVRLLHGGHRVPQDRLCPLLPRDRHPARACRGLHGPPHDRLGHAAGAPSVLVAPGSGAATELPHPRSRREIRADIRRRLRQRGHHDRAHALPRAEGFDHLFIVHEAHLRHVLTGYAAFFNQARPHQGLDQHIPLAPDPCPPTGPVRCRDTLGGLLHDYYREAA